MKELEQLDPSRVTMDGYITDEMLAEMERAASSVAEEITPEEMGVEIKQEPKPKEEKKKKKKAKVYDNLADKVNDSKFRVDELLHEIAVDITGKDIKLINVKDEGVIKKYVQDPHTLAYRLTNHKALYERVEEVCYEKGYMINDASMKQLSRVVMQVGAHETFEYEHIKNNILCNNALLRFVNGKVDIIEQDENQLKNRIALKRIFVDYNKDLADQNNETVEKFLMDIMKDSEEMVEFLLNALATSFVDSSKYETAFFLYGPDGANGKSTLYSMFRQMIGSNNISAVEFSAMSSGRGLELMDDKLVNWVPDMEKYSKEQWTVLKKVTSGERVTIDRKFVDPVEKDITAQIFVNTNTLPKFGSERDGGKDRRVTIIPFLARFSEENRDASLKFRLKEKTNIEWLFAQLIKRAAVLMEDEQGLWFFNNTPELVRKAKDQQIMNDSTAVKFMEDLLFRVEEDLRKDGTLYVNYNEKDNMYSHSAVAIVEGENIKFSTTEIYKQYKHWAEATGYIKLNQCTFLEHIEEIGFKINKRERRNLETNVVKQGFAAITTERAMELIAED